MSAHWWRGESPSWRALLSAAWRGALVPTAVYALFVVPVVAVTRLKDLPGPSLGAAATAVVLTWLLTTLGSATLGTTAFLILGRFGAAGVAPFALCGALTMLAVGLLARTAAPLDAPYLLLLGLHGATAAASMWWAATSARPSSRPPSPG